MTAYGTKIGARAGAELDRVANRAGDYANSASAVARDAAYDVRDFAEDKIDAVAKLVKDRPVTSILVGVGIGFLLSKLFSR